MDELKKQIDTNLTTNKQFDDLNVNVVEKQKVLKDEMKLFKKMIEELHKSLKQKIVKEVCK